MSLLEQFDYLRNNDSDKRQAAFLRIFSILDIGSKPIAHVSSLADLKEFYGTDVQYTYGRLIKGLASGRESARIGFSAALSELLRALPQIEIGFVLDSIEKATTPSGNAKGQEIRDYQFGRLFGIQSISTSGVLTRAEVTIEDITPVLVLLYELALTKGWFRESCANVIITILKTLDQSKSALLYDCTTAVHEMLHTSALSKTIEGVAIHIQCLENGSIVPVEGWSHGNPLHASNLTVLNKVLRDQGSDQGNNGTEVQIGTWKPKLHFAWTVIIRAILEPRSTDLIAIEDLWRVIVDEGMFSVSASHERKAWGFQIFNILVSMLPGTQTRILFSPNFLRTLTNQLAQADRYLNKAARHTILCLLQAADLKPEKAEIFLSSLWSYNIFFDRTCKEKPCEKLLTVLPDASKPAVIQAIKLQCNPTTSKKTDHLHKEAEQRRQYVSDCLLLLLKSAGTTNTALWVTDILDFLLISGYFHADKPKRAYFAFEPELSEGTRKIFQSRLTSAMGILMPTSTSANTTPQITHVITTFATYRQKKHFNLILQPDDSVISSLESAEKKIIKLSKRRANSNDQDQHSLAFILLYSMTIVEIYAGEPEAAEVLADIDECYVRLLKAEEDANAEQGPMESLIDLLLTFLSKESVLYRRLVDSVFTVFAAQMTSASMQLLLNVLNADESGQGLFDVIDDEAFEDEEDEDEHLIAADEAARNDRQSDAESDDNESLDEEGSSDAEVDGDLEEALAAAYGGKKRKASEMMNTKPAGEGHESDFESDDGSDGDEELMDDDQMLARDAFLVDLLKGKKDAMSSKKQNRNEQRTTTQQLKRKVLDLIDTFVRTCPSSDLILDTILPILASSRTSSNPQYTEKAHALLRSKIIKSKVLPTPSRSSEALLALLTEVHREAERCTTPPQLTAASQTSLYLVRVLVNAHDADASIEAVVRIYADTQVRWLNRKNSRISTGLFVDFVNWCTQWRVNRHKKVTGKTADVIKHDSVGARGGQTLDAEQNEAPVTTKRDKKRKRAKHT